MGDSVGIGYHILFVKCVCDISAHALSGQKLRDSLIWLDERRSYRLCLPSGLAHHRGCQAVLSYPVPGRLKMASTSRCSEWNLLPHLPKRPAMVGWSLAVKAALNDSYYLCIRNYSGFRGSRRRRPPPRCPISMGVQT